MKIQDIVLLITPFVFLTSPARGENSPWPMFRHDERHTGRTTFTGPAEPVVAWELNVDDRIGASPVLGHDGTIYFGTGTGPVYADQKYFYAVNPDGTIKWTFPVTGGIFSSAAVGQDGTIYVGSFDNNLYAIKDELVYGRALWQTDLGFFLYSSPTIGPDGAIYIGSLSFDFWSINPDGTPRWQYPTGWCIFSSPALAPDGTIYVGSKDEHLYAFREDGSVVWATATGTFYDGYLVDSSPAIGEDGTIYVGTDPYGAAGQAPVPVNKVFYAFRPDGTIKWIFPMEDGAESSPAIGPDGTVYVGSYDGNIYALEDNGDSATLKWRYETGDVVDGSPAVDGCGIVYIGSRDGYLYALNPDGSLRWKYLTDGGIESSPAIDGSGRLYFGTLHGTLYCIGEEGPDVGVSTIASPDQTEINTYYNPSAVIGAYRSGTFETDVSCTISFGEEVRYNETVHTSSIDGGETMTVHFPPWAVEGTTEEEYTISFTTLYPGDTNAYNDTLTTSVALVEGPSGIHSPDSVPQQEFILYPCYPNPFNGSTTISFSIPRQNDGTGEHGIRTRISVYDLTGRVVRTVLYDNRQAGIYTIRWNGLDDNGNRIPSGMYLVSLSTGNVRKTTKIVLMK
ncbi:PQQ-binding-like beta-propeller repeat protein [Candidatus Latescibacterota bacterium]